MSRSVPAHRVDRVPHLPRQRLLVVVNWLRRFLFLVTLKVHRSRLNWREAPKYTRHWRRCIRENPRTGHHTELAERFWKDGSVSMGAFELESFLRSAFRCEYAEFYRKTYRVEWSPQRLGSQLYHADGGPGTCIIVMRYDSHVSVADGPLEVVDWKRSLEMYAKEPRIGSRDALCAWYESQVKPWDRTAYTGPKGTVIAFMNNTLHRGGYPAPGHTRDATVTHYYPSLRGEKTARAKTEAYPRDPDI